MNPFGTPLVSVVVPAWNAASTLAETLQSVAAQSYSNIEIIVVDDGSTDETPRIAELFCACEPRARLVRKENGGVASARNRGIAEAGGEWVAPVDADDLWHPTKIEKQVAAAMAAPQPPGFVYCWYHYLDADSRVIGSRAGWVTAGPALNQLAYENFVGNGSALLLNRAAALAAGGYDTSLRESGADGCEDLLLQLMVVKDWPVAAVPEYLVGYRVAGRMSQDSAQMRRAWEMVFEILDRRGVAILGGVRRQALGIEMFYLAEANALYGNRKQAVLLLTRALWLDPARCGLHLVYRLLRSAVRLGRGRRPRPQPVPFSEADPKTHVELDADSLPRLARALRRIDERRLARLRAKERPLG